MYTYIYIFSGIVFWMYPQSSLTLVEAMLFVCNYSSPSLIKSDVTTATFSMIGHVLGSEFGPHACGLLLCPVYSYGKHQLFLEEHALLKALSNASCSVDTMFQLNFDIKSKTVTLKSIDIKF